MQEELEIGAKLIGKADYVKFLNGKRLTMKEAIQATCYECNGMEEATSCEVPTCPLFQFMPYNPDKVNWTTKKNPKKGMKNTVAGL